MGKFSDKYGRKPQISAGLLSGAICMGSFPFSDSFTPLLVLSILFALSHSLVSSATFPFIADLSQRNSRGLAMGVLGSIMDIGHAAGPLLSGVVASYFGLSKSFLTAVVVLLFASFVFNLTVQKEK
jgi:MFS family permease